MSRRIWELRFVCGHAGCLETSNYRYPTQRDMRGSFELKNYSDGRWRCVRHAKPDELLSLSNNETQVEIACEVKNGQKYFGHSTFLYGPGFRAFSEDFPEGTRIIVTARVVVPEPLPTKMNAE